MADDDEMLAWVPKSIRSYRRLRVGYLSVAAVCVVVALVSLTRGQLWGFIIMGAQVGHMLWIWESAGRSIRSLQEAYDDYHGGPLG